MYGPTNVEIIDPVTDYLKLLKLIFDFTLIKNFLHSTPAFSVLFNGLHGVTGPYTHIRHSTGSKYRYQVRKYTGRIGFPTATCLSY